MTIETKQNKIIHLFNRIIDNEALKHAYLFEGYSGTGKLEMSRYIAKRRFCTQQVEGRPCQTCSDCLRITEGQHPDVIEIAPEGKGMTIKVDRIRQLKDEFSKSGIEGQKKVIIVNHIDKMTQGAANSLLKFLEDPSGDVTIFLLVVNKQNVLPTIISRCQVIQFTKQPLTNRIADLQEAGLSKQAAHLAGHLTQDDQVAVDLVEEGNLVEIAGKVWDWYQAIMQGDTLAFVRVQTDFMPLIQDRRDAHLFCDLMLYLYRDLMHLYYNVDSERCFVQFESDLRYYVDQMSITTISNAMTAILEAKQQLDHNVASQGVLERLSLLLLENTY